VSSDQAAWGHFQKRGFMAMIGLIILGVVINAILIPVLCLGLAGEGEQRFGIIALVITDFLIVGACLKWDWAMVILRVLFRDSPGM